MSTSSITRQAATVVPDDRRHDFMPAMFGMPLMMAAEFAIYSFMEKLSPLDYRGGYWQFFELDNKPLFIAPTSKPRFRITGDITTFQGEVSAEAAGIIATLFTCSHLSFQHPSELLPEGFARLHAYVDGHAEASEIFRAID
ncbi:antirestriction protein [Mesorhizobium denitrificans]|uniref:Antirestriction protein n=1 Tax=Mesorhizobium denitrificans TaxID=2294114 RepID=A0A371X6A4_9HYPH|nr:antirestriction protein [Mesorhizobium denitrificans]RFC64752.1 antirestriction protein [Mesorhizobium denitrificans]